MNFLLSLQAAEAVAGSLARLQDEQARNERTVAQMRKRKELLVEVDDMKKKVGVEGRWGCRSGRGEVVEKRRGVCSSVDILNRKNNTCLPRPLVGPR